MTPEGPFQPKPFHDSMILKQISLAPAEVLKHIYLLRSYYDYKQCSLIFSLCLTESQQWTELALFAREPGHDLQDAMAMRRHLN